MVRVTAAKDQFHKTKICPHLSSGGCRRGVSCSYAHNEKELRNPPDLQRTRLCDMWQTQGTCPNGTRCPFAHGEKELRFTTAYFKTDLCKYWKSGFCVAGDECRHAHGIPELRPRKFNEGEVHLMKECVPYSRVVAEVSESPNIPANCRMMTSHCIRTASPPRLSSCKFIQGSSVIPFPMNSNSEAAKPNSGDYNSEFEEHREASTLSSCVSIEDDIDSSSWNRKDSGKVLFDLQSASETTNAASIDQATSMWSGATGVSSALDDGASFAANTEQLVCSLPIEGPIHQTACVSPPAGYTSYVAPLPLIQSSPAIGFTVTPFFTQQSSTFVTGCPFLTNVQPLHWINIFLASVPPCMLVNNQPVRYED